MKPLPAPHEDTPSFAALREAFSKLRPDTPRRFGTMDPAAMVRHCLVFDRLYLGEVSVSRPMRWLARALGPIFLRRLVRKSPTETPRGLKTLPPLRVAPGTEADLEAVRADLFRSFEALEALEGTVDHPLYGPTRAADVKVLARHHTAHHAHQFGLLDA